MTGKELVQALRCCKFGLFWLDDDDVLHTCLSAAEMRKYANGANGLYGWHIYNLKIYDTPARAAGILRCAK